MPYKLKDNAPKDITDLYRPNVLGYSGVIYKNEVPLVKLYPQYFTEIGYKDYEENVRLVNTAINAKNKHYIKQEINEGSYERNKI